MDFKIEWWQNAYFIREMCPCGCLSEAVRAKNNDSVDTVSARQSCHCRQQGKHMQGAFAPG